jgi:predicted small secreted protein
MKKIALLFVLFTIVLSSCNTRSYVVSDLNAVGVVIKKKTVNDWEGSQYKYKVWINPETSVWLVLNDKIEVGDTVYIKSETKMVLYAM